MLKKITLCDAYLVLVAMHYRAVGARGPGGWAQLPLHILADELSPIKPGWADYAHHITSCPPDFQTFLRPCTLYEKIQKQFQWLNRVVASEHM